VSRIKGGDAGDGVFCLLWLIVPFVAILTFLEALLS